MACVVADAVEALCEATVLAGAVVPETVVLGVAEHPDSASTARQISIRFIFIHRPPHSLDIFSVDDKAFFHTKIKLHRCSFTKFFLPLNKCRLGESVAVAAVEGDIAHHFQLCLFPLGQLKGKLEFVFP
jgi:hypothetical protein